MDGFRAERAKPREARELRATEGQRPDLGVGALRGVLCDVVASGGAVVRGSWPSRELSSGQFQATTGGAPGGGAEAPAPWGRSGRCPSKLGRDNAGLVITSADLECRMSDVPQHLEEDVNNQYG